jgi:zeaxanthin glucosyltransferase
VGLRSHRTPEDSFSRLAQISQLVRGFDLPRGHLPESFHYVGPYRRFTARERADTSFPYDELDGRPIVFASLGTMQGNREPIWRIIAEACSDLDVQLVIALGQRGHAKEMGPMPGNPIVADYAPQVELLSRASLAILHGGLNGTLEALAAGVPIITVPITGDQFGVAARVVYSGTGKRQLLKELRPELLRSAIREVLLEPRYRERARHLQVEIAKTGGAAKAAEIIEQAIEAAGRPGKLGTGLGRRPDIAGNQKHTRRDAKTGGIAEESAAARSFRDWQSRPQLPAPGAL